MTKRAYKSHKPILRLYKKFLYLLLVLSYLTKSKMKSLFDAQIHGLTLLDVVGDPANGTAEFCSKNSTQKGKNYAFDDSF